MSSVIQRAMEGRFRARTEQEDTRGKGHHVKKAAGHRHISHERDML